MSYLKMSLGEIATNVPGATAVLFSHKINFCCNADMSLKAIIDKKGLNADDIISTIEALASRGGAAQDWSKIDNQGIIEHILTRYHQVHREQLTELIRLANRVETVHGSNKLCPVNLADHLIKVRQELEQHMQKEEEKLFPMLIEGHSNMASGPISVMMSDHEHHIESIDKIYTLTNDLSLHPEACNTWRALYLGLQEFISDINMHIHIENNILFPRALNKDVVTPTAAVGVMSVADIKEAEPAGLCCGACT
jgi:regulator of cell morphogenesis and NO signaling